MSKKQKATTIISNVLSAAAGAAMQSFVDGYFKKGDSAHSVPPQPNAVTTNSNVGNTWSFFTVNLNYKGSSNSDATVGEYDNILAAFKQAIANEIQNDPKVKGEVFQSAAITDTNSSALNSVADGTTYTLECYNQSSLSWNLCLFIGGGINVDISNIIPLAWSVASFPAANETGPGTCNFDWSLLYGVSVVTNSSNTRRIDKDNKFSSVPHWVSSTTQNCNIGYSVTVSWDGAAFSISSPAAAASNVITVKLDASVAQAPSTATTTLALSINNKPAVIIDSKKFKPNLTFVFTCHPTYTVCGADFTPGDQVDVSSLTNPDSFSYFGGATDHSCTLQADNTWTDSQP